MDAESKETGNTDTQDSITQKDVVAKAMKDIIQPAIEKCDSHIRLVMEGQVELAQRIEQLDAGK